MFLKIVKVTQVWGDTQKIIKEDQFVKTRNMLREVRTSSSKSKHVQIGKKSKKIGGKASALLLVAQHKNNNLK